MEYIIVVLRQGVTLDGQCLEFAEFAKILDLQDYENCIQCHHSPYDPTAILKLSDSVSDCSLGQKFDQMHLVQFSLQKKLAPRL